MNNSFQNKRLNPSQEKEETESTFLVDSMKYKTTMIQLAARQTPKRESKYSRKNQLVDTHGLK
jgi:hypothetical protein